MDFRDYNNCNDNVRILYRSQKINQNFNFVKKCQKNIVLLKITIIFGNYLRMLH